jgi:CheY-like chemotaxis protein
MKPIKRSELFDAIMLAMGITTAEDEALEGRADRQPPRLRELRILLAEDSLVNQKLATALLQKWGHRVTVVNNGRAALAALGSQEFDLILMDVQMPEMDGLEATAAIRAKEKRMGGHIPIIAMTAHALKGDRERCLDAGMDDYVAKPIHARELSDSMEALLGSSAGAGEFSETAPAGKKEFDWAEALAAVSGDRQLLRVVVQTVLDEAPELVAAVRRAVAREDPAALKLAAHSLKGSIRYFGPSRAAELAWQLEKMAREGTLQGAEMTVAAMEGDMQRLVAALHDFLRKDPTSDDS